MLSVVHLITDQLKRRNALMLPLLLRQLNRAISFTRSVQNSRNKKPLISLITPEPVRSNKGLNVGAELTSKLDKREILDILHTFANTNSIKELSLKYGLNDTIFTTVMKHFCIFCTVSESLPADLHIIINDISKQARNITDIFPYFLRHAKQMYPHIDCLDDLKKISDLRHPPLWYPTARSKKRRVIFHCGPTNSGKTYHALKRFLSAKSGIYCGPLRLLAAEIYEQCNKMGTPCDLITGEELKYAKDKSSPSDHVSCSVEMVNVENSVEVAVIDEIQMIRDPRRGWAWTKALLGVAADELHLCGEAAAIPIIQSICLTIGEKLEVKTYKRLTKLEIENKPLESIKFVQPGDCIMCLNKNDLFKVSNDIETLGMQVAVIYGSLPPGTKLAQAARFNDPKDPCKILVATNAIGMGLNLHIRRMIFYSLIQRSLNDEGQIEDSILSVSSALQIAGRAGRYKSKWQTGYVTTFKAEDLPLLKRLLSQFPENIYKAGLYPTSDQIELYAYYLPNSSLSNLIDIFITLCQLDDSLYFICDLVDFKFVADLIEHISLPIHIKYVLCCAPLNRKIPFMCSMFLKYARQCSNNTPITGKWLREQLEWPFSIPLSLISLKRLECVFDILDIYLWLSHRMPKLFPDVNTVEQLQRELDDLIQEGIQTITTLLSKQKNVPPMKEKLSHELVDKGLLTPKMLRDLKDEWSQEYRGKEIRRIKITSKNMDMINDENKSDLDN